MFALADYRGTTEQGVKVTFGNVKGILSVKLYYKLVLAI